LDAVKELIALGALPECPKEKFSYLDTPTIAMRMLLLEQGADPKKIVEVDMGNRIQYPSAKKAADTILCPVFALHFINTEFEGKIQYLNKRIHN
jgi:hypothetical protein